MTCVHKSLKFKAPSYSKVRRTRENGGEYRKEAGLHVEEYIKRIWGKIDFQVVEEDCYCITISELSCRNTFPEYIGFTTI